RARLQPRPYCARVAARERAARAGLDAVGAWDRAAVSPADARLHARADRPVPARLGPARRRRPRRRGHDARRGDRDPRVWCSARAAHGARSRRGGGEDRRPRRRVPRAAAPAPRAGRRGGLVVAEIALALPLLVAAMLSISTVTRYLTGWQGYDPNNVLTVKVVLPEKRYPDADSRARFVTSAIDDLATRSGVRIAAAGNLPPGVDSNS